MGNLRYCFGLLGSLLYSVTEVAYLARERLYDHFAYFFDIVWRETESWRDYAHPTFLVVRRLSASLFGPYGTVAVYKRRRLERLAFDGPPALRLAC